MVDDEATHQSPIPVFAAILLEHHEANPNLLLPSEGGVAPIHYAAGLGHEFVELLLKFGANPNVRSCDGSTPLHISAPWDDDQTVCLLLLNGADPSLRDENGDTPLELALESGHVKTVKIMEDFVTSDASDTLKPRFNMQLSNVRRFFPSPLSSLNSSSEHFAADGSPMDEDSPQEEFVNYFVENSMTSSLQRQATVERKHFEDVSQSHSYRTSGKENEAPEKYKTTDRSGTMNGVRTSYTHSTSMSNKSGPVPSSYTRCDILTTPTSSAKSPRSPRPFDSDTPDRSNWTQRKLDLSSPICGWKKRPMAGEKCATRKALNYSKRRSGADINETYDLVDISSENDFQSFVKNEDLMTSQSPTNQCRESPRDRVVSSNLASPLESVTTPPLYQPSNPRRTLPLSRTVSDVRGFVDGDANTPAFRRAMTKSRSCSALSRNNLRQSKPMKFSPVVMTRMKSDTEFDDSLRDFLETEADCLDETWDISDGLNTTRTLNKELEKLTISDSASKHRIDVTSPDHPLVELKETSCSSLMEETRVDFRSANSELISCDESFESCRSPDMPFLSLHPGDSPTMPDLTPQNPSPYSKKAKEKGAMPVLTPQNVAGTAPPALTPQDASDRSRMSDSFDRPSSNQSDDSSTSSLVSVASILELEYRDSETGQALIERRIPSLAALQALDSSGNDSFPSLNSVQSLSSVLTEVGQLDDRKLRDRLLEIGDQPGPVTEGTRRLYMKRLTKLIRDPALPRQTGQTKRREYPYELRLALRGGPLDPGMQPNLARWEAALLDCFSDPQRQWREGKLKSSFNYILLDPAVSQNLPLRSDTLDDLGVFQTFIDAIFYIGKGKRSRPLCHFYEALGQMDGHKDKVSDKVTRILDIWANGNGVISLHCYQNTIPVEAYTREACMIDAMGIGNLTNVKRGDYYGQASTWSPQQRKQFGVHLLKKACHILLYEGERQIRPGDIR